MDSHNFMAVLGRVFPGFGLLDAYVDTQPRPVLAQPGVDGGAHRAIAAPGNKFLDGVEQLSRYLDLMRRDTLLGTVYGILAAQQFKPQARVLAQDRGISCVTVDYEMLRGLESPDDRLF
jgi:endonuclease